MIASTLDGNPNSFSEVELSCDCNAMECPCCTRPPIDRRQTVGETNIKSFRDTLFEDSETECSEDLDDEDHMMPGLLEEGISYTVRSVMAQGWIHKKGTGLDMFASRAWKARWAVLVVSGTEVLSSIILSRILTNHVFLLLVAGKSRWTPSGYPYASDLLE
jgi:hypothetical protein